MKNIKKFGEFTNKDIKSYFDVEEGICPKCGSDVNLPPYDEGEDNPDFMD